MQTHSKPIRTLYFTIGAIATIAYRVIIILSGVNEFYLNLAWYVGTIGFIIYFAHRYQISESRAKLIQEKQLDEKIGEANLSEDDRQAMEYIFKSLKVSTEKVIYIIIFISSGLALLAGIYKDFIIK